MLTRGAVTQNQACHGTILPCHSPHLCKDLLTFPANTGTALVLSHSSSDGGDLSEALSWTCPAKAQPSCHQFRQWGMILCPHSFPQGTKPLLG